MESVVCVGRVCESVCVGSCKRVCGMCRETVCTCVLVCYVCVSTCVCDVCVRV